MAAKAASAVPVAGVFVKSANAAKGAAEKGKAAQPKSQGSGESAKQRAEDRQAQVSERASGKATAVVQPKSLREWIGAALEEADEFIDSGLRSSRQLAQEQIDEEKNDPNKAPDVGTTARRLAAGAYAAVHDNVTSTAELVGTLDKAVQGDEEASRKVEQTAGDLVGGVANTVNDPKGRRKASLRSVRRKLFKDRDEWPRAVFKEGGKGASVRHIGRSDNRGSGAALGNQLRGNKAGDYRIDDGTRIRVFVKPPTAPTP
ncbi:NucA/NucB deoxyribonuclease domain-containing protein [Amycolatopsis sp. NPDC051045]|uniref:NucA/NucB deoxyribonuclease domain-containing protein n=1 Tax=Amycolatopsis sp. NPDC051045 TaxID=3156922 RepID=UPI0034352EBF